MRSTRHPNRTWRLVAPGLVVIALAVPLAGCSKIGAAEHTAYQPATVEEVEKSDLKTVTFTEEGAGRVGLQTAPARQSGRYTVVPYAALIYDGQGKPWVYTNPGDLTFRRSSVVVDHIDGDQVFLSSGLRPGVHVATVGATELYGAELDISGGH